MKRIVLLIIICLSILKTYAQNAPFTTQQIKSFDLATQGLLDDYTGLISRLAKTPPDQIPRIDSLIEDFFIPGAIVQVTTIKNKGKPYNYALDYYVKQVVPHYKLKFNDVIVYFQQVRIDDKKLKKIKDKNGNTAYEGNFSFTQVFCVKYNGKFSSEEVADPKKYADDVKESADFCENTQKKGTFVIQKILSPADGDQWEIRLGSILINTSNPIQQTKP